ncbi:MAG TPA: hypothetical protein VLB76_05095 [Thermoanaerobaculia bacterium]|jgi:hypothetical protein|nr:hypothetical protein [Thermoanaerobaculia bacterium]
MSWTLLMADEEGTPLQETFVLLDDELVGYLSGLTGFPVFQGLRGLDPAEETWIDAEVRGMWEREVAELAARARKREIPEPPEWVGLEGTDDIRLGEELGWRGLLDFLQRLEHLLHLSRTMGMELWALPND